MRAPPSDQPAKRYSTPERTALGGAAARTLSPAIAVTDRGCSEVKPLSVSGTPGGSETTLISIERGSSSTTWLVLIPRESVAVNSRRNFDGKPSDSAVTVPLVESELLSG